MIKSACFQSPIGLLPILAVKKGVVKISFQSESRNDIDKWWRNYLGLEITTVDTYTLDAKEQILSYLNGKIHSLDFPVVHIDSPFRKKVLEAQRNIPYGETRSYKEVAQMVESPKAYRSVGSANATNPLPLYYPCHRIINSNGSLGRFAWGLPVKEWLLNLEVR